MATFSDDTLVMANGGDCWKLNQKITVSCKQILSLDKEMANKTLRIQIGSYWVYKKEIKQQSIFINDTQVPYANTAKYLGMIIHAKLRWKEHIKKTIYEYNFNLRQMYWLFGRNFELSIHKELILYKQVTRRSK
jgi:hypothetical protein